MKKRFLSLLLAIIMVMGTISIPIAFAEDTAESYVSDANYAAATTDEDLTKYVNMSYGTGTKSECLIGPSRPNGSVHPGPDTYPTNNYTGYYPNKPIRGFSQLHIQSGEGRFGQFLISPQVGLSVALDSHDSNVANENPTATEYSVTLAKYDIDCALTPTENAVIYKFTYPQGTDDGSILLDMIHHVPVYNEANGGVYNKEAKDVDIKIEQDADGNTVLYGGAKYGAHGSSDRYYYFYAVIDSASLANKTIGVYKQGAIVDGATSIDTDTTAVVDPDFKGTGAYLKFDLAENAETTVRMKIAVSFKDVAKAKASLEAEIPAWDYDKVKNDNNTIWNDKLDVMEVSGLTEDQKIMFYSNLYDTFLQPRYRTGELAEYGDGMMLDDHVATWDTFRTLFPLLSITNPQLVTDQVESYLVRFADKEEGSADTVKAVKDIFTGFERSGTNQGGDNIDNVIAEAYVKGLIPEDMMDAVYELVEFEANMMRVDRRTSGESTGSASSTYKDLGFIPADQYPMMNCNTQLEYCYNDYCLAQIAYGEGDMELYNKLMARSASWLNIWNEDAEGAGFTGFIWPKNSNGTFVEPNSNLTSATYRVSSWKPYFYEGTPYEYSFFVPHDMETLIEKMGGEKEFIERLQVGIDNGYIHIGNQPGYIQAFLFNYTSEPWHTTDYVEQLIKKYTINGTPGCEDSGASCAWYIFANVGFFPNAGQDIYWLTSPKYEQTTFNLDNGKTFVVKANNLSDENKYIQSVTLNGEVLNDTMIRHSDIVNGGTLVFNMGDTPVNYASPEVGSGKTANGEYNWSLRENGVLSISGEGDGTLNFDTVITEDNFSDIPWNAYKNSIKSVSIAESSGIVSVSDYVFADLPVCEKIIIPKTLTDLGENGIFAGDSALYTVCNHDSNTEGEINLKTVTALGTDIFKDCSAGLTVKVRIGEADFAPVKWFTSSTTVNFAVDGKTSASEWLSSIETNDTRDSSYKFTIGKIDTIAGGENTVYQNEYSWTLDTESGILTFVNNRSGYNELAFSKSSTAFNEWVVDWKDEIQHIVIPSFSKFSIDKASNGVTSPFAGLTNLKTVKIDTTRWLLNSHAVFENCKNLTTLGSSSTFETGKIKLEGFDMENLSGGSAAPMFKGCKAITSVDYTGLDAFSDSGNTPQDLKLAGDTFLDCTALTEVIFGNATAIAENTFNGCSALREITIPASVTSIGKNAFVGCTNLQTVTIESTSFTAAMANATSFPDQAGLTIYCPNKTVKDAFDSYGYTKTKVVYEQYVTGSETAGNLYSWTLDKKTGTLTFKDDKAADKWCELSFTSSATAFATWVKDYKDEIKHIVIPSFDKFAIDENTKSPFAGLQNLQTVKIDTTRWLLSSSSLFEGCTSLTSLGNSSNFEEGKIKLSGYKNENLTGGTCKTFFTNCSSITSIDFTGFIPMRDHGKTTQDLIIGSYLLAGCTALKEVILADATVINANAFKDCTALVSITIPTSVTSIAADAFSGCTALRRVTLEAESFTNGLLTSTSLPDIDGLIVYCQNGTVAKAVNALGFTLTKAVSIGGIENGGVKMEGFSIKMAGTNGLRGIFSFDNTVIAKNKELGFTLVEYGTILASEANKNAYGTELTFDGTNFVTPHTKVLKKAIWSDGGIAKGAKILSTSTSDTTRFAVTIVEYTDNFDTNVCMLGYSVWMDATGKYHYYYVDCENDEFDATSIYRVTLGMYKSGHVNKANDPDGVIWGVLSACAATLTAGTDYRNGDRDLEGNEFGSTMKFLEMPLYEANGSGTATGGYYSGSKALNGSTYTRKGNLTFTILPDGDSYVAIIRGTGELPVCAIYSQRGVSQLHPKYNSHIKFNTRSGNPTALLYDNAGTVIGYVDQADRFMTLGYDYDANPDMVLTSAEAHRRQPTPTLLASMVNKLNTVILDDGITKISHSFFIEGGVNTVIYANTVNTLDQFSFMSNIAIKTMSPKGTKPTDGLMDLSGFTTLGVDAFNEAAFSAKSILLPKGVEIPDELFKTTTGKMTFTSISTNRKSLIEGVADLRGITSIGKYAFCSNNITTIYFDDSIAAIGANAFPNQATKVYTNAENVSVVDTFVSSNSKMTYSGNVDFATAAGLQKDPTIEVN